LDQFSPPTLEMHGIIFFNQILLSLFDVSKIFYDNIWVNIEAKIYQMV